MTPACQVTPATAADHLALAELWEASVRATHGFLDEAYLAWIRERLVPDFFPMVELRVARDATGAIVGFLGVAGRKLEMLFVDPARRGGGIGRLLLAHAVDAFGADALDVNEQNAQAVGFYQRMGFVVASRSDHDGRGKPYPLLHMRRPAG